ncbi:hypothetical protein PAXRUDRAFT_161683 [Paxillus rubicundulus Ve08.2h10]|uniref:Myb/SANT-like domain-containing protein n=1 Tax=Paxillus rubicundulus Ve08.2h10 TaxID=930991 RepID=A0A0D0DLP2_9AGAM|nr:hypothetical protein PAXRUDRAFT_161683 [Paxillus rubicundulus Ve08.2h10]
MAQWKPGEVTALIDYLYNHCSQCANSGNFRMATYNMAGIAISKDHQDGHKKTGTLCKNKWAAICTIISIHI